MMHVYKVYFIPFIVCKLFIYTSRAILHLQSTCVAKQMYVKINEHVHVYNTHLLDYLS